MQRGHSPAEPDELSIAGFPRNLHYVMQHATVHVLVQLIHIGCQQVRAGNKLNSSRVSKHIMEAVYKKLIEGVLTFNIMVW